VIAIILRDLRWRMAIVAFMAVVLYFLEPGFHQHEEFTLEAVALGPLGISATLAYLAGLAMIVLLGGFIAGDRRQGYSRLYFSHPTSPLGYYGLRWGIAYALSLFGAAAFLLIGQLIAWGTFHGGWRGMLLPALSALVYGGLVAFFSVVLPRGDTWVVFLLFLPTFFPQVLSTGLAGAGPAFRQAILALLPPHGALQDVWDGLLLGSTAWWGIAMAAGYGALFLGAAALILRLREWP
jgi:hypothetical protein